MENLTPPEWQKNKIWAGIDNTKGSLASNLEQKDSFIPDRKKFKLEDIAKVKLWWDSIALKEVKEDHRWNYIEVQWKKYHEYKWVWGAPDSLYIFRRNSIFIWDRMTTLPYWEWVFIKCINDSWESIHLTQSKARYNAWDKSMHVESSYKSATYLPNETITTVKKDWKVYSIKKALIDKYIMWEADENEKSIIRYVMKKNPAICAFIEDLEESKKQNNK